MDTDVSLEGDFDRLHLVVTDDGVSVARDAGGADVVRALDWSQIDEVRTTVGVGSGRLQAKVGDEWVDLLRFSNTLAHRFDKVARRLDIWAREGVPAQGQDDVDLLADVDPPACPKCELRLPPRQDSCPRCLPRRQLLQRAWTLMAPYWRGSLGLCLLTIVGVIAELIPPKLQQYMVDHLLSPSPGTQPVADVRTALLVVVLALALSRIVLSVVGVFKGRLATAIGSGLTCSLRKEMVAKLQNLAVAYYDRHQVGSMISRVAHDSEVLHGLMHQLTGGFLLQTVQLVGVGAMLLWLNPKLAMFTLIPVPARVSRHLDLLAGRLPALLPLVGRLRRSRFRHSTACCRGFASSRRLPRRTGNTTGLRRRPTDCATGDCGSSMPVPGTPPRCNWCSASAG